MSIFSNFYKHKAGYKYSTPVTQNLMLNNGHDVKSLKTNTSSIGCVSAKKVSLFDELSDVELSEKASRAHLNFI